MDQTLTTQTHGDGIVEVGLSNGPVNALTAPFLMDFANLIKRLSDDPNVRALVLTSPFKVFSAGLNLKQAQDFDLDAQNDIVEGLNVGFGALFSCPRPTVVAVSGAAIAGGLFFVLASDLRVAHPAAQFGLAEVRVGVDFPVGPMEIARATLSPNMLRRLMLTGQPVGADLAEREGMVDIISDTPVERALKEAQALAAIPSKAFAQVKHQIRAGTLKRIEDGIAIDEKNGWFTEETRSAMRHMIG